MEVYYIIVTRIIGAYGVGIREINTLPSCFFQLRYDLNQSGDLFRWTYFKQRCFWLVQYLYKMKNLIFPPEHFL